MRSTPTVSVLTFTVLLGGPLGFLSGLGMGSIMRLLGQNPGGTGNARGVLKDEKYSFLNDLFLLGLPKCLTCL